MYTWEKKEGGHRRELDWLKGALSGDGFTWLKRPLFFTKSREGLNLAFQIKWWIAMFPNDKQDKVCEE